MKIDGVFNHRGRNIFWFLLLLIYLLFNLFVEVEFSWFDGNLVDRAIDKLHIPILFLCVWGYLVLKSKGKPLFLVENSMVSVTHWNGTQKSFSIESIYKITEDRDSIIIKYKRVGNNLGGLAARIPKPAASIQELSRLYDILNSKEINWPNKKLKVTPGGAL